MTSKLKNIEDNIPTLICKHILHTATTQHQTKVSKKSFQIFNPFENMIEKKESTKTQHFV